MTSYFILTTSEYSYYWYGERREDNYYSWSKCATSISTLDLSNLDEPELISITFEKMIEDFPIVFISDTPFTIDYLITNHPELFI